MSEINRHTEVRLSASTKEKLKDTGVAVVYFFGSRASGTDLVFSDIDIGIVMEDANQISDKSVTIHEKIYDIISSDIPDRINGPKLDISFLQKANPALAMKAICEGEIIFESNAQ